MRSIIPYLIVLMLAPLLSMAQLVITNDNQQDITNGNITINATSSQEQLKTNLHLYNLTDQDARIFVRKTNVVLPEGMNSQLCIDGFCYSEELSDSKNADTPLLLKSGRFSSDDAFSGQLKTNGNKGTATVKYEFYSPDASFTPVHVTVNYTISDPLSLNHSPANEFQLAEASPNPANEHTWIPYHIPSDINNAEIVLRNLLGNKVTTVNIDANQQSVRLDTSSLNNGIYIYSLVINNQPVMSKRLLVAN